MERERKHKNYFSMRKYNKGLGQDCDAKPSIVWKYFVFAMLLPEMPRLVSVAYSIDTEILHVSWELCFVFVKSYLFCG